MAILKCKMCGGDMELAPDKTFGTCEYCGSTMTLPRIEEEQLAAAFNRGNHFRRSGEFDKALSVYERIVEQDDGNAEAHWCCALCRFGIEYVEDPTTYEWLPTCHRASFDSFLEDVDYLAAVEHSDGITRRQYQKDGAKIAEVQRGILATSRNAEPYDVFISYKELDENKNRTRDSILAQDIYYQLTEQGRRVFFSRITLEDVPGTEYEPYIFAALNSAKVMIVVGTSGENLNAVWVKNEWSRFLSMIRKDRSKLLLPCYRDMDPYDLPEQLSVLMSYDMGKIGFIQDLIRGVNKVLDADKPRETVKETVKETVVVRNEGGSAGVNVASLIDRGNMALEDKRWEEAKGFFDRALDADSRCGAAYWGLFLEERRASSPADLLAQQKKAFADAETETLTACEEDSGRIQAAAEKYTVKGYLKAEQIQELFSFDRSYESKLSERKKQKEQCLAPLRQNKNLQRAAQYGDEALKEQVQKLQAEITAFLDENIAKAKKEDELSIANIQKAYAAHLDKAEAQAKRMQEEALAKQEADYRAACENEANAKTEEDYEKAAEDFRSMEDYRDSPQRVQRCITRAEELRAKAKAEQARKRKKTITVASIVAIVILSLYLLLTLVILPSIAYKEAEALFAEGEYEAAVIAFAALGDYKDAATRMPAYYYAQAEALLAEGNKPAAAIAFGKAGNYKDAHNQAKMLHYELGQWKSIAAGAFHTVGLRTDGTVVAVGYNGNGRCEVSDWTDIVAIAAGGAHSVGLRSDGTVVAVGDNDHGQCRVSGWTDIVAIAAGGSHTVGLRSDGTVVATEYTGNQKYYYGQCEVSDWTDMVAIAAGDEHTVGLRSDGTVVAVGGNDKGPCRVSDWTDIVAIAAGASHTVGLRSDGTVVAVGSKFDGECDVSDWTDIVAIAAGIWHTVGLRSDGTLVDVGNNKYGQRKVSGWTDIVAIAAGRFHTVGLRSDGTVVATEYTGDQEYYHGECEVSGWTDIVAIAARYDHTVGLRSDGTVVAVGDNDDGQCKVSSWTDIRVPQKISG